MPAVAILPVKRFDRAKQRLDGQLPAGSRAALAAAMCSDVLGALERAASISTVMIVSGEPLLQSLALGPRAVLIPDIIEKGQSSAAQAGLARAAELETESTLLIPGDCPLADCGEIDDLVASSDSSLDVVIVPDRHQLGTNALLIGSEVQFEPQFGENSLSRHCQQAEAKGLRYSVQRLGSLELDIDTADDLAQLVSFLELLPERAPRTRALLRQLERTDRLPVTA